MSLLDEIKQINPMTKNPQNEDVDQVWCGVPVKLWKEIANRLADVAARLKKLEEKVGIT